jgi:hypothetical protein
MRFPRFAMERPFSRFTLTLSLLLLTSFVSLALGSGGAQVTHAASKSPMQYDQFFMQDTVVQFRQWTLNGVKLQGDILGRASLQLQPDHKDALNCTSSDIDGGATSYNASAGLCAGTDPMTAGSYDNGLNYYNGGNFYYGTLTSPVITTKQQITTVISSWDATTPTGTWLEVHVRTLQNGSWTHWYDLPIWASDFSTIHRHSVDGQSDKGGLVATDTYYTDKVNATAYQLSYTLFTTSPSISPTIRRISAIASFDVGDASQYPVVAPDKSAWGINLPVPQRSQELPQYNGLGYGGGGEVWCSPTSTSMVAAYWSNILNDPSLNESVPDTARDVYDFTYQGTGNWPFNTAYTGAHGLRSFVTRMYSLSQIEQWIKVGVPIVVSIAWGPGQLPGADISSTPGHLMVVRGFTSTGDVIANDPASPTDAAVLHVYPRAIFQSLWLNASNGTVYVNYPESWPTPAVDALGSWSSNDL